MGHGPARCERRLPQLVGASACPPGPDRHARACSPCTSCRWHAGPAEPPGPCWSRPAVWVAVARLVRRRRLPRSVGPPAAAGAGERPRRLGRSRPSPRRRGRCSRWCWPAQPAHRPRRRGVDCAELPPARRGAPGSRSGSIWHIDVYLPDLAPGHYPNNGDVMYLWRRSCRGDSDFLAHFAMYPFWALLGVATYALAAELRAPRAAAVTAACVAARRSRPWRWPPLMGGLVDSVMLFGFASGLLFLLRHARNGRHLRARARRPRARPVVRHQVVRGLGRPDRGLRLGRGDRWSRAGGSAPCCARAARCRA